MKLAPSLKLTPKETAVLALIHQGYENAAIAKELGIAVSTVVLHLFHMFQKIGCSSRLELAVMTMHTPAELVELRFEARAARKELAEMKGRYEDLLAAIRFGREGGVYDERGA